MKGADKLTSVEREGRKRMWGRWTKEKVTTFANTGDNTVYTCVRNLGFKVNFELVSKRRIRRRTYGQ